MTDRVQLPRLYLAWLTPGLMRPGDAALDVAASLLSGGKNSRLYKRLVYELQIAQDVTAYQQSQLLGSAFYLQATARPGKTVEELQKVIDEEIDKLAAAPPEPRELERVLNQIEASFLRQAERVGGFGGKANQLNAYYTNTGMPDFFAEDLARYRSIDADDISSIVAALPAQGSPRRDDRPAGRCEVSGPGLSPQGTVPISRRGADSVGSGCRSGACRSPRSRRPDRSKPPTLGPAPALEAAGGAEVHARQRPAVVAAREPRGAAGAGQPGGAVGRRRPTCRASSAPPA